MIPHYVETYLKQVRSLNIDDLVRVAKTYLIPQKLSLCSMSGNADTTQMESKLQDWLKLYDLGREVFQTAPVPRAILPTSHYQRLLKDPVEEINLSGARLYLYKTSQTPTVSLDMGFSEAGLMREPLKLEGLSHLVKRAWPCDTAHYTEDILKSRLDQLATFLQAFSGRNTMGLSLTTLSSSLRKVFPMLEDVLQNPLFLENVVEREKQAMRKKAENRNDNPFKMVMRLFEKTLFKNHPYSRDPLGTKTSLKLITQKDVISYWKDMRRPENMVICAVGDFDSGWIQDQFGMMVDQLHPESDAPQAQFAELKPLNAPQKVFKKSNKAQSSIVLGYRGLNLKSENRFVLKVLETVLSGQGGRLFLELRDKASLAYTVMPVSLTGLHGGFFAIYIGSEKAKKALSMMRAEVHKLCEERVLVDELDRAKKHLIGRYNIALQKNASLSSAIFFREIYGISHREIFDYPQHIQNVTPDQLLELSQKIFSQPETLVVYGPVKPW